MKSTKIKKINKKIMVDLIVTAFNNKKIIGKCLNSVKAQKYDNKNLKIKCVVVDDNSSDGTSQFIKKSYRWVKVIKKSKHLKICLFRYS